MTLLTHKHTTSTWQNQNLNSFFLTCRSCCFTSEQCTLMGSNSHGSVLKYTNVYLENHVALRCSQTPWLPAEIQAL